MPKAYSLDLARLAAAYAEGALTPGKVVRDVYSAIEADCANPMWIHVRPRSEVEAQARALEAQRAAGIRLPLYGVPFAVKDNIDVAGCPTTAACPAFSYMPKSTAHAVQRLQDAGALMIGKTNLDQFAAGLVGTRSPYGACRNAFDKAYISGGSSSGSALAVATGAVSFALGTDTAGSGRVPAAFNNVVGLKPTRGRVSTHGVVPACRSLDCVSVFSLTCSDAYAVLGLMEGFDPEDIFSRAAREENDGAADLPRFRCGVPDGAQLEFFGDAAAAAAFARTCETLAQAGAEIVEVDFRPFAEAARLLYEGPWVAERFAALKGFMREHAADMHPVTREVISTASRWSSVDAFEAYYGLRELKRRCEREWSKMDVLAVPSAGTIYTLEQVAAAPVECNSRLGYYTNFVNLMDLAALAVPGPFRADGLPAGVTLIAPAHRDRLLAVLGERVHRAGGVRLGATRFDLPALSEPRQSGKGGDVVLAVVGAHLAGLPLNYQLTVRNARLVETTKTAARYRLFALHEAEPRRPGLVRVGSDDGAAIEVELWSVPLAAFGAFVAEVAPPLAIGTVTLDDGRTVKGFICETYAIAAAQDISAYGGWRAYLARQARAGNSEDGERHGHLS